MSAAAAAEAAPAPKGKKKLILIIAGVLVLALAGGGAALVMSKKKAAAAEAELDAEESPAPVAKQAPKFDPKAVPVFVPLEPFTVNLADRDAERYAQVGITLEIDDPKTGEMLKVYMPAIRNHILMAIADRTAGELMGREGKAQLADKVKREVSRTLGYEVAEPEEAAASSDEEDKPKKSKAKAKKKAEVALPVKAVHFSNFIIQ